MHRLSRIPGVSRFVNEDDGRKDPYLWSYDHELILGGQISYATLKAFGATRWSHSQVEISPKYTFVGIYDGHGGSHEAAEYVFENLYNNLMMHGKFNPHVVRLAVDDTERGFQRFVARDAQIYPGAHPLTAASGTSCLFGIIRKRSFYIAHMGDSRAVCVVTHHRHFLPDQLTQDDNIDIPQVRVQLQMAHPADPHIVVQKPDGFWVKGVNQKVTKSIGDAYLKVPGYQFSYIDAFQREYCCPERITRPVVSSEPTILTRVFNRQHDRFIIFASRGLWEHLSNEEACTVIRRNRKKSKNRNGNWNGLRGVAELLIRKALVNASRKKNKSYNDVKKMHPINRAGIHGEITVIVVSVNMIFPFAPNQELSINPGRNPVVRSNESDSAGPSGTAGNEGTSGTTEVPGPSNSPVTPSIEGTSASADDEGTNADVQGDAETNTPAANV